MKHWSSVIAVPALGFAAVALTSAEAAADLPAEHSGPASVVPHDPGPPNYPTYSGYIPSAEANVTGSADDTGDEILRVSTAAVGGAGLALAGLWLYKRKAPLT